MGAKEKWINFCCKMLYFFKPIAVILTCLVFMIFIDAVCISFLLFTISDGIRDILIAILTGVTASALVAVIIEMANNYQRNDKRWLQLARLFSVLTHYEQEIEIKTGHFDTGKAHLDFMKKLHGNLVKKGSETQEEAEQALEKAAEAFSEKNLEDDFPPCDRVQCVFGKLPELIPLIEDAYRNHSDEFRRGELESMYTILDNYQQIKDIISMTLMEQSTLLYGKDPKNPGDLVEWLPKRLKRDLDRGTLLLLAEDVWETEREHIAEILVRQGALSLDYLGIKIGDDLLTDDDLDEQGNDGDEEIQLENAYGQIISRLVDEMDRELLQLRKIIKAEPGFNTIFAHFQNYSTRYRR